MALARKGSRLIVVGGTTYRWRLRGQPTYDQALCDTPCTYAVQRVDTPGTTLVVTTNQWHASNWFGAPSAAVLPSNVSASITLAPAKGWHPTIFGSPLEQSDGRVRLRL